MTYRVAIETRAGTTEVTVECATPETVAQSFTLTARLMAALLAKYPAALTIAITAEGP